MSITHYIPAYKPKRRKCTTCGKPTTNYRCEACWKKLREKYGQSGYCSPDPSSFHSISKDR